MAVNVGTRPGTKENQRIPGWDYTLGKKTGWVEIRKNDREVQRFEAAVGSACADLERALIAANIAHVLLHGGHVSKEKMAQCGLRPDLEPGQVLSHIESLLPKDLAQRALK